MFTSFFIILTSLVGFHSFIELPIVSEGVSEVIQDAHDLVSSGLPDAHRNPCQLIESRNFICVEHFVTTLDGYILTIDHVVNPTLMGKKTLGPVVLQHGFFGSATHWLINSEGGFADDWTGEVINVNLNVEGRNAGYLLSNLGYDVWIPNLRGCRYSRNHTHLNPDTDKKFWEFSYEQMITYDAPTIVDYILNQTGYSKLAWIGHSMGNTIMFGLLSEKPEYSTKITVFIALAPVAYQGHCLTPLRAFADTPILKRLLSEVGGEFTIPKLVLDLVGNRVCVLPLANEVCAAPFYLFGGYNPQQFNLSRLPVYVENGVCGASSRTVAHFGFNLAKDQFAKFDYGLLDDVNKYGSFDPPEYNLSAINLKNIVLMQSNADLFSSPKDVTTLKYRLTVPYIDYVVTDSKFGHLDFLWAGNVYKQVYEPMVKFLRMLN